MTVGITRREPGASDLRREAGSLSCRSCDAVYEIRDGVPHMYPRTEALSP